MRSIIFDIETCAYSFETLSESQREYLLRYAEKERLPQVREEKINEAIRYLSLYPFTAKVIALGIFDVEKEKSFVYYENCNHEEWESHESGVHYKGLTESEILNSFWRIVDASDRVITFNGRGFDIPFIMLRSALHKIKPAKNLMTNRYDTTSHVDLLDQFTFYGMIRKFNLDFYCRSFGIESPKSRGISGIDVKNFYEAGRIKDIAVYCGLDVRATFQLYKIWENF